MATIKVYGRIRPPRKQRKGKPGREPCDFSFDGDKGKELKIRTKTDSGNFGFNGRVFGPDTVQEDIFDTIAEPVIDSVLQGYNGTIFAYGQSGSGKTYTMTGAPASYKLRGIIPRSLNKIFEHVESCKDTEYTIRVSYLEIYKNRGYDLLDPRHEPQQVGDLPKVTLRDDGTGNVQVLNLNSLPTATREQALNHLFVGDTNRMICETANNLLSSRSHCVFTVYVQAQAIGSEKVRVSKLNLVDLAGSERPKTVNPGSGPRVDNVGINVSLHHLANVIVALNDRAKGRSTFVPYRNSMLTMILKDSLGGNCKTTMIATLSVEQSQIPETISTCRFAQRVAAIPNKPVLNEAVDPKAKIDSLERQLQSMRQRAERRRTRKRKLLVPMTAEELQRVAATVKQLLCADLDPTGIARQLLTVKDRRVPAYAFALLRTMVLDREACAQYGAGGAWVVPGATGASLVASDAGAGSANERAVVDSSDEETQSRKAQMLDAARQSEKAGAQQERERGGDVGKGASSASTGDAKDETPSGDARTDAERQRRIESMDWKKLKPQLAAFRKTSTVGKTLDDNSRLIRDCHAEAKEQGVQLELVQGRVQRLKRRLQELAEDRPETGDGKAAPSSEEEAQIMRELSLAKREYKDEYKKMKQLKIQLQHQMHVRKRLNAQLKNEFCDQYWGAGSTGSSSSSRTGDTDDVAPATAEPPSKPQAASEAQTADVGERGSNAEARPAPKPVDTKALFEQFRRESSIGKRVSGLRRRVADLMARAQGITRDLNNRRDAINRLKGELKSARLRSAVQEELVDGGASVAGREEELIAAINKEKQAYKAQRREYDSVKDTIGRSVREVEVGQKTMAAEFRKFAAEEQRRVTAQTT